MNVERIIADDDRKVVDLDAHPASLRVPLHGSNTPSMRSPRVFETSFEVLLEIVTDHQVRAVRIENIAVHREERCEPCRQGRVERIARSLALGQETSLRKAYCLPGHCCCAILGEYCLASVKTVCLRT